MSGRKYISGTSSYRYSINGQEKESELNENITTALFWEYDSRTGRRWNMDPKPNIRVSPYNSFGSNPILNSDSRGDTLDIPFNNPNANADNTTRVASENDIFSLVNKENIKYIKIAQSGRITIDDSQFGPLQKRRIMNSDKGFSLLVDLITNTKVFSYAATPIFSADYCNLITDEFKQNIKFNLLDQYPSGSIISHSQTKVIINNFEVSDINSTMSNLSFTLRGDEANNSNFQLTPTKRYTSGKVSKVYDGQVTIARGEYYNQDGTTIIPVQRASIIYHELRENYFRVMGQKYIPAHDTSIEMEEAPGSNYGNPSPGITPQFFKVE